MRRLAQLIVLLPAFALWAGCERQPRTEEAETVVAAAAVVEMPVTTASEAARADFNAAVHNWDMGRGQDAHKLFVSATEKDPGFVRAHLHAGNTSGSWEAFRMHLDGAKANLANANEGEKLLIEWNTTLLDRDLDKRLKISRQLVEMYPSDPRWMVVLGDVQEDLNQHEAARATYAKALALDPNFIAAHTSAGFSYLNYEPKDYGKAEMHMQKTVDLQPTEPVLWVNLGDVQRGSQRLMEARASYRKATELDPTNDLAWSKSGHANSFLGYYDEARSDFDQAMATAEDAQKVTWGNFKAYVSVYAGDPAAAVKELQSLYESIDGAGIPEDQILGTKIGVLDNLATIAQHHGMLDVAAKAVTKGNELREQNAERVGTEEFKRGAKANVALWAGRLAARKGEFAAARAKAEEHKALRQPENNPRKLESYHGLMGFIELRAGNHQAAIQHYRQANLNNMYHVYHLALAEEGAGNKQEANRLFKEVAEYNFNAATIACIKNDAMARAKKSAA